METGGIIMKYLLTGKIGVGKTVVCEKIVEKAQKMRVNCCGIVTQKVEEKGKNIALLVKDLSTGESRIMAYGKSMDRQEIPDGIHFCNWVFDENTIEFAEKAIRKKGDLLIIDEIGYLEVEGKGINNAISAFKSPKNKNAILVVRNELEDYFSNLIDCDFKLIEVNKKNRRKLPQIIFDNMFQKTFLSPQNGTPGK
jgi:nucleoside-triphosphatase THEP1